MSGALVGLDCYGVEEESGTNLFDAVHPVSKGLVAESLRHSLERDVLDRVFRLPKELDEVLNRLKHSSGQLER